MIKYCTIYLCDTKVFGHGLCNKHYKRWKRNGDPLISRTIRDIKNCILDDCNGPHKGLGYCEKHYTRFKKYGDPNFTKIKGYHFNAKGYIMCLDPLTNKHRAQHRIIMQQNLGRELLPNENVHHLNGDRTDNRIENLEIWSTSQPSGQRIEDKVAHAIYILEQYAPEHLKEKVDGR